MWKMMHIDTSSKWRNMSGKFYTIADMNNVKQKTDIVKVLVPCLYLPKLMAQDMVNRE
jgi:hypothetical protein